MALPCPFLRLVEVWGWVEKLPLPADYPPLLGTHSWWIWQWGHLWVLLAPTQILFLGWGIHSPVP